MFWKKNQLVWIEVDLSLGPAKIIDDSEASFYQLKFLESSEIRNYTKKKPPFKRLQLAVGQKLRVRQHDHEITVVRVTLENDYYYFESVDGRFSEEDIVKVSLSSDVLDLVRLKKLSHPKAFHLRRQALEFLYKRNTHRLKGIVGCRVQTLPHQIHVVDAVLKMPQIRALLADEVGLGKTIEAGLVFSALHAKGDMKRVLILVPNALKVQWLTEIYRRFNVRFRLDHDVLIEDEDHRDYVIASLEELEKNDSRVDLLIVDEAHRLIHDEQKSEALSHLVAHSRHVLFLSATPRVDGDDAFLKMMSILGRLPEEKIQPLVFQSRRAELGIPCFRQLEAVMVRDKRQWIFDFIEKKIASKKKEKVFLIASQADYIIGLCRELRAKFGEHFAIFHEQMNLVERDRQAAYFASHEGAQFLISSEIGGEGRNFQFCHELVLLDLPEDPLVVEQRIGRLDRLGQTKKVSVWCPVLEDSAEEELFEIHKDHYQVFSSPWSGAGLSEIHEVRKLIDKKNEVSQLEALAKNGSFVKVNYNKAHAESLLKSLYELENTNIQGFLDDVYDLFGVEVEDFDTSGNWRVFTSTLMFVDYFPGLGESGERVFTFSRAQALAREDMTYFSVDHPEFIETLDFLIGTDQGKFSFSGLPPGETPDVLFLTLLHSRASGKFTFNIWSQSRKQELAVDEDFLDSQEQIIAERIPQAFWQVLPEAVSEVMENYSPIMQKEDFSLDSLLVMIPKN